MIKLKKRSGIVISREYESQTFYQKIRGHLFRRSRQYNTPDYIIQKFFVESNKFLTIPRFFPVHEYVNCKIEDISHGGEDINISHNITPRNQVQKDAIKFMMEHDNGVIELQPGMGKTVISIYMIAERKKKALILVHRDSLVDQWKGKKDADTPQGFLSFTNLQEDDVVRMSSATFEEDLKKPVIITTNQAFLSILKHNRTELLMALDRANIGVFIGDEVHTTIGAAKFSECSIHVPAKIVYGLSATPYRWDGNSDIINYHLGEVYRDQDTSDTLPAKVTVLMFDYGIDIPKRFKYLRWEGQFQRSRYLNLMRKSKILINISKALLVKLCDRQIFFISERLNLIDLLFNAINGDKSKFIAGSSLDELKKRITFSTPGKCRDGIDAQWKDACILTSPIKNIHQMTGRINRIYPNKKIPIVIDMVDIGCPDMSNTYYGRLEYYKSKEWDVRYLLIDQRYGKHVIDERTALNVLRGES